LPINIASRYAAKNSIYSIYSLKAVNIVIEAVGTKDKTERSEKPCS